MVLKSVTIKQGTFRELCFHTHLLSLFSPSPYRITIFYWFWFIFLLLLFEYVKENICKLEILIFTLPHNKTCTQTKGGAHYVPSEPCFKFNNVS